jgi:hypothetical protein
VIPFPPPDRGIVSVESNIGVSEFAEFTDALRGQRTLSERAVRHALRRVGDRYPGAFSMRCTTSRER